MPGYDRVDRQAEELRRGLDAIIRNQIKDPRIPEMFSITGVELSRDLRHAKVSVSCMAGEEEARAMLKALKGAAGFLRRELGKQIILRAIPELSFTLDTSIAYSVHIASVLKDIHQKDEGEQ